MSKISLTPNAAGTGTFTIAAPGTNTDRTLTLPDASGTLATTADIPPAPAANVQTFNSSGTWTKPASGSMARIQVWGAGGSGGRNTAINGGGGGGGGYSEITVPLSTLASTVTVTVGSGGAGRSGTNGAGNQGGNSSFGAVCLAYGGGGGGGSNGQQGGGGGQLSAGPTSVAHQPYAIAVYHGLPIPAYGSYGVDFGGGFSLPTLYHGGLGKTGSANSFYPPELSADAMYGGAGGGSNNSSTESQRTGGVSLYGGNGGAGTATAGANGTAGTQPGGGGGACVSGTTGQGGAGRVIVTVW